MHAKGFVPPTKSAEEVWKPIFAKYNQTKRGLKAEGMIFDEEEYWEFHRSGVELFLTKDESLRSVLQSLPQKKYLFTNCHEKQALTALKCLGVDDCFDGVFGAAFMGDHCKPEEIVYHQIIQLLRIDQASKVVLFEDSYKNLVTASRLGMKTVFIESITAEEEGVSSSDKLILSSILSNLSDNSTISQLKSDLPELFE